MLNKWFFYVISLLIVTALTIRHFYLSWPTWYSEASIELRIYAIGMMIYSIFAGIILGKGSGKAISKALNGVLLGIFYSFFFGVIIGLIGAFFNNTTNGLNIGFYSVITIMVTYLASFWLVYLIKYDTKQQMPILERREIC